MVRIRHNPPPKRSPGDGRSTNHSTRALGDVYGLRQVPLLRVPRGVDHGRLGLPGRQGRVFLRWVVGGSGLYTVIKVVAWLTQTLLTAEPGPVRLFSQ